MGDYILVIDEGTTSTRAIVFDRDLNEVALAQQEVPLSYPNDGWVEQDGEEIWDKTVDVCRKAIAEAADRSLFFRHQNWMGARQCGGCPSPRRSRRTGFRNRRELPDLETDRRQFARHRCHQRVANIALSAWARRYWRLERQDVRHAGCADEHIAADSTEC